LRPRVTMLKDILSDIDEVFHYQPTMRNNGESQLGVLYNSSIDLLHSWESILDDRWGVDVMLSDLKRHSNGTMPMERKPDEPFLCSILAIIQQTNIKYDAFLSQMIATDVNKKTDVVYFDVDDCYSTNQYKINTDRRDVYRVVSLSDKSAELSVFDGADGPRIVGLAATNENWREEEISEEAVNESEVPFNKDKAPTTVINTTSDIETNKNNNNSVPDETSHMTHHQRNSVGWIINTKRLSTSTVSDPNNDNDQENEEAKLESTDKYANMQKLSTSSVYKEAWEKDMEKVESYSCLWNILLLPHLFSKDHPRETRKHFLIMRNLFINKVIQSRLSSMTKESSIILNKKGLIGISAGYIYGIELILQEVKDIIQIAKKDTVNQRFTLMKNNHRLFDSINNLASLRRHFANDKKDQLVCIFISLYLL